MRNLEDRIKKLIIEVLNCNITDAIYVFGSYGTQYYEEGVSDIDIAWFTSKKIDLVKRSKFRDILEEVLDISVDLVIVDKNSTEHLLYNIFETGECIFIGSKEFESWFDYFYDSTYSDREFLSIYMEKKIDMCNIRRLEDILDNETIASKTGLDLELIKSIRK